MVRNWILGLFRASLDEKLYLLECGHNRLVKRIGKGQWIFSDNDVVIEFSRLLTNRLKISYLNNGMITDNEEVVLDKILADGIYSISFYPDFILRTNEDREVLVEKMIDKGFKYIESVGYVSTKKIPYISV